MFPYLTYSERWQARADEWLTVYVPSATAPTTIRRGSGIVGRELGPILDVTTRVLIHYEGNVYGADNLRRYADRVAHAAGRFVTEYPTIARAVVPLSALVAVGRFRPRDRQLVIEDADALARWLPEEAV